MSMAELDFAQLPETLKALRSRPLFVMHLDVQKPQMIGPTPAGTRRIGVVPGGRFKGERLSGEILEGGSDWQTMRADQILTLDVRLVLKTDDDALICMTYKGLRHGANDANGRIDRGEVLDPHTIYFRSNPMFETSAAQYAWLNGVIAIGIGHRLASGPIYSVFEIL
jgi:hypothetical protein